MTHLYVYGASMSASSESMSGPSRATCHPSMSQVYSVCGDSTSTPSTASTCLTSAGSLFCSRLDQSDSFLTFYLNTLKIIFNVT